MTTNTKAASAKSPTFCFDAKERPAAAPPVARGTSPFEPAASASGTLFQVKAALNAASKNRIAKGV
jgi:hypothetical protein